MGEKKHLTGLEFKADLERVIGELIEKNLGVPEMEKRNIQVKDIAQHYAVTPNTIRRWCVDNLGMSTKDFLLAYRITMAKRMLAIGARPSAVSLKLAFTEHKTFSSAFRRVCNMTPKEYGQLIKNVNHTN